MSWLAEIPRFCAIILLFYLPGFAFAALFHKRSSNFVRLAAAPAWTGGVATILTLTYGVFGLPWNRISAAAGFALLLALCWAALRIARRRAGGMASGPDHKARSREDSRDAALRAPAAWQPAVAALVLGLVACVPILVSMPADGIIQGGDSQFHIGMLWKMAQDGVASPLAASAGMMGLNPANSFYPTAWHAIVVLAVLTPTQALVTANVVLMVAPVMWMFSILAFTWVLLRSKKVMWWALAAAGFAPMALLRLEMVTTLWPFVMGMAIVPGFMALVLEQARGWAESANRRRAWMLISWVAPALGVANFHPSAFLPGVAAIWLGGIVYSARAAWQNRKAGWEKLGTWTGALFFLISSPVLVYNSPYAGLFELHRIPEVDFGGLPTKLINTLTLYSPGGGLENYAFYLAVFSLSFAAAFTAWRLGHRWLVIAWGAQMLIVLASYIPVPIFSRLTSLYYNVPLRGHVGVAIFLVPMLALAFSNWAGWLARRFRGRNFAALPRVVVPTLVFVAACAVLFPANAQAAREMVHPGVEADRYLAGDEEISMIKRASQLPQDSYILGDPAAGASLVEVVSNRKVVWPYPGMETGAQDAFLSKHFNEIQYNPRVCSVVRSYGITHFYKDRARFYNSSFTAERRPGMYGVDTSKGFTKVDEAGAAAIYRIDMCYDDDWAYDEWPTQEWESARGLPGQPSIY